MAKFAENTTVSVDKSKVELERLLTRYGATNFGRTQTANAAMVVFTSPCGRNVKFELAEPQEKDFRTTKARRRRTAVQVRAAVEQAKK